MDPYSTGKIKQEAEMVAEVAARKVQGRDGLSLDVKALIYERDALQDDKADLLVHIRNLEAERANLKMRVRALERLAWDMYAEAEKHLPDFPKMAMDDPKTDRRPFADRVAALSNAEAIAAWNTRAERTCQRKLFGWQPGKMSQNVHYVCSECEEPLNRRTNYCPNCGAKVVD